MTNLKTCTLTVVLSLLALLSAFPAWAYEPCGPGLSASIPVDGSEGVATNAHLALWYLLVPPEEVPIRLIEAATIEEIPLTIEPVEDSGGLYLFHPVGELKANTLYTIEWFHESEGFLHFASFETGAERDEVAPEPTEITCVEKGHTENEGGTYEWVEAYLSVAENGIYHRIEVSRDASFSEVEAVTLPTFGGRAKLSTEACIDLKTHPHDVKYMRVFAIDGAGNEAQISNEKKAKSCSESEKEYGMYGGTRGTCSTLVASTVGWMVFAVLPFVASRRRRDLR